MVSGSTLLVVIILLVAFGFASQPKPELARTRRVMATGLGALVVIGLVYRFRALLPPFIVPLLLAYLLDPVLDRLERTGHTRVRAVMVIYALALLVLGLAALLIVPPVLRQVTELAASVTRDGGADVQDIQKLLGDEEKLRKSIAKKALDLGVRDEWVVQIEDNLESYNFKERLVQAARWSAQQLSALASWLASQMSSLLLWLVLMPFTLFYFLLDFDPLRRRLYYLVPPDRRPEVASLAGAINRAVGSYVRGYAVLSLVVGTTVTTALLIMTPIFHFRYGLLIGLLAGCTYFIPYIGTITSVVLATAAVYFTGGHNVGHAAIALVVLQTINTCFDSFLTPRVIGQSVGLHPLLVMFALLAGGAEFGLLGVILATPFAFCVKIVLEHFFPRLSEPIPDNQNPDVLATQTSVAAPTAE